MRLTSLFVLVLLGFCTAPVRPQDPALRPYPHYELRVPGAAGDLGGELVLPAGTGPFPAVLLLAGSGPQGRDETVAGHRWLRVMSDQLARAGIASLRYDKRGVGDSDGDFAEATISDFARDAEAAFDWLAARPEIDPAHIALLGHSEGGMTALLVAADRPVAAVVTMAGPGLPMDAIIRGQVSDILHQQGIPAAEIARIDGQLARALDLVRASAGDRASRPQLAAALERLPRGMRRPFLDLLGSPWATDALQHDPAALAARVDAPILALFGGTDLQVNARRNAAPLAALAVRRPAARRVEVHTLDGLNHLFQPSATGALEDYARIETTIAPAALDAVIGFLKTDFDAMR